MDIKDGMGPSLDQICVNAHAIVTVIWYQVTQLVRSLLLNTHKNYVH